MSAGPVSTAAGDRHPRTTRSFARRGDRLPERLQRAWDRYADTHLVDVPRHGGSTTLDPTFALDLERAFARRAPLVVEIGSGAGETLVHAARQQPDTDFLGIEVWRPGIAQTLARLGHEPAANVRLVEVDAARAVRTMLPSGSASQVWTFFPDPWPKRRHHKRRLVSPAFARDVARVLGVGGLWRLATDWGHYATWMREVVDGEPGLELLGTGRFPGRPVTRFERKGLVAGHTVTDLAYRRR